jgi:dienelactone hydrolase
MRPFESLLLIAFIPALLLPAVSGAQRRYFLWIAVLLPILMSAVQIGIEGARLQIVPLYGLAVLLMLGHAPALIRRDIRLRRGRSALISVSIAIILVGTGVMAGWLLPIAKLPIPTGDYDVGVIDRELNDPTRDRRLMVSVWYPAAVAGTPAPLVANPNIIIAGLADSYGFPAFALDHLRYFTVHASMGAPILEQNTPFPVLVFSHSMTGLRLQNSTTLQDLASWGYIVVAIDHTDAAAITAFADGEVRPFDLTRFSITVENDGQQRAAITENMFPVLVADQRFVYDTLELWATSDAIFAGKIDTERIGSFGHSFGGATALEVCRVDRRCRAAADLDGGLYGAMLTAPTNAPTLLMTSAGSTENDTAMRQWTAMINAAMGDSYWIELPNSDHLSFTLAPLLSPILVSDGFDQRAGLNAIDRYVRAFFDVYLRDGDPQRLDPANADDVRWIMPPARTFNPNSEGNHT